MSDAKTLGLVLISPFADWEYGYLAGSAREWFGAEIIVLSPEGGPVASIGGLKAGADRAIADPRNRDLSAVAVIGSDAWATNDPDGLTDLLRAVHAKGGVVAGICGGTLALARAGLFAGRAHTSNGVGWIDERVGGYSAGADYRDVAHAVSADRIVSAPGTAPGTFAAVMLEALYPERGGDIAQMRALFAREYVNAA